MKITYTLIVSFNVTFIAERVTAICEEFAVDPATSMHEQAVSSGNVRLESSFTV